jgi:4-amino-4-deoxy-L-arabinose transferase-like glycosyltransferase
LFTPTARLREAARVGFLVPARVSYLLFGAVPGFYAYRYLLALIAIVPLYLLLKRLYGRWAGFLGIAVVMSSPVLLTAWGTDYPDSASVSYLTGGFAALALSFHGRRGARWLMTAGALLMLAVWSHGASVPLVVVLGLVYLVRSENPALARFQPVVVRRAVLASGGYRLHVWLVDLGRYLRHPSI